jgi:hypothetical protein
MTERQQMPTGARIGLLVLMTVIVVPVVFGGVCLVGDLVGHAFGVELTDGWTVAIAAVPTAYISWRLWRVAVTSDDRDPRW